MVLGNDTYFTDEEYRVLLSALDRERKVCEQVDKEYKDEGLISIMSSIERKIHDMQYHKPVEKEDKWISGNTPKKTGYYLVTTHEWSDGNYLPKYDETRVRIVRFTQNGWALPTNLDKKAKADSHIEVLAWRPAPHKYAEQAISQKESKNEEKDKKLAKIWFRTGMEAEITKEEMKELLVYSGQADGERDVRKAHGIMENIIKRSELSGETYIVGKDCGGVDDYDNPDEEIDFLF